MSRSGPGTIGDLGEFGLIDAITARFPARDGLLLGPGDDAAVIAARSGSVVATTDLLVEGRHFRRDFSSAYDIGRKAAAQNLADIAAMGARPTALLVGFAAPADTEVEWALALADGLRDECDLCSASVAGGDVSWAGTVVLGVTALGDLDGAPPVRRAGARAGDLVVLTGRLGWAEGGLALLHAGRGTPREIVAAHRRPQPPYAAGPALSMAGATAMCDVSDGLVQDLGHIADASGVGVDLDSAALAPPALVRDAAAEVGVDPLRWVLAGGDDHALVACVPPAAALPAGCSVIGRVFAGRGVHLDGRPYRGPGGHDHFR